MQWVKSCNSLVLLRVDRQCGPVFSPVCSQGPDSTRYCWSGLNTWFGGFLDKEEL